MRLYVVLGCFILPLVSSAKLPKLDYANWSPIPGRCLSCEGSKNNEFFNSRSKKSFDTLVLTQSRQVSSNQDTEIDLDGKHSVFAAQTPEASKVQLIYIPEGSLNDLQSVQLLKVDPEQSFRERVKRSVLFPSLNIPEFEDLFPSETALSLTHAVPRRPTALIAEHGRLNEAHEHVQLLEAALSSNQEPLQEGELPRVFIAPTNLEPPPGYVKIPLISNENQMKNNLLPGTFLTSQLHEQLPPGFVQVPLPKNVAQLSHTIPFVNPNSNQHFSSHDDNSFDHNRFRSAQPADHSFDHNRFRSAKPAEHSIPDHFRIHTDFKTNSKNPETFHVNQDFSETPAFKEFTSFNDFTASTSDNADLTPVEQSFSDNDFHNTHINDNAFQHDSLSSKTIANRPHVRGSSLKFHNAHDSANQNLAGRPAQSAIQSHQTFNFENIDTEQKKLPIHSDRGKQHFSIHGLSNLQNTPRQKVVNENKQFQPQSFRKQVHLNIDENQFVKDDIHVNQSPNFKEPQLEKGRFDFKFNQNKQKPITNVNKNPVGHQNINIFNESTFKTPLKTHAAIQPARNFNIQQFDTSNIVNKLNTQPDISNNHFRHHDKIQTSLVPIPSGNFNSLNTDSDKTSSTREPHRFRIQPKPISETIIEEKENSHLSKINENHRSISDSKATFQSPQIIPGITTKVIKDFDKSRKISSFRIKNAGDSNFNVDLDTRAKLFSNIRSQNEIKSDNVHQNTGQRLTPKPIESHFGTNLPKFGNIRTFEPITQQPAIPQNSNKEDDATEATPVQQNVRQNLRSTSSRGRIRFRGRGRTRSNSRLNNQVSEENSKNANQILNSSKSEPNNKNIRTSLTSLTNRANINSRRRRPTTKQINIESTTKSILPTTTQLSEDKSTLFPPFSVAKRLRPNEELSSSDKSTMRRNLSPALRGRFGSRVRSQIANTNNNDETNTDSEINTQNPISASLLPNSEAPLNSRVRQRRVRVKGRRKNPQAQRQRRVLSRVRKIENPLLDNSVNEDVNENRELNGAESARITVSESPTNNILDFVDQTLKLINNDNSDNNKKSQAGKNTDNNERNESEIMTTIISPVNDFYTTEFIPVEKNSESTPLKVSGNEIKQINQDHEETTHMPETTTLRYVFEKDIYSSDSNSSDAPSTDNSLVDIEIILKHDVSDAVTPLLSPSSIISTSLESVHDQHDVDNLKGKFTHANQIYKLHSVDASDLDKILSNASTNSYVLIDSFESENSTTTYDSENRHDFESFPFDNDTFLGSNAQIIYAVALSDLDDVDPNLMSDVTDFEKNNDSIINSVNYNESDSFLLTDIVTNVDSSNNDTLVFKDDLFLESIDESIVNDLNVSEIKHNDFYDDFLSFNLGDLNENSTSVDLINANENMNNNKVNNNNSDIEHSTNSVVDFDMESLQNLTSEYFSNFQLELEDPKKTSVVNTTAEDTESTNLLNQTSLKVQPDSEAIQLILNDNDTIKLKLPMHDPINTNRHETVHSLTDDYVISEISETTIYNREGKLLESSDIKDNLFDEQSDQKFGNDKSELKSDRVIGKSTVSEVRSSAPILCLGNKCVIGSNLRKKRHEKIL